MYFNYLYLIVIVFQFFVVCSLHIRLINIFVFINLFSNDLFDILHLLSKPCNKVEAVCCMRSVQTVTYI